MPSPSSLLLVLFLVPHLTGCTAWRLEEDRPEPPIPVRKPFEIWSQEQGVVVHGVRYEGDSLRAVPRWRAPDCDSCAVFFALSEVDSIRARRFSSGRTIGLATGIVAALVIYGLTQYKPGLPAEPQ